MRLFLFLALLGATILPAAAQSDIAGQARSAYGLFAGGLSQKEFLSAGYGRVVLAGLDGRWARLSGPDEKSGAETYGVDQQKICAGDGAIALSAPSPLLLRMQTERAGHNLQFDYSLIAGSTFSEHIDPMLYLDSIGLGPSNKSAGDTQRALALSFVNGLVNIFRPSPDILVMTRDRGYPLVMARCPAK